MENVKSVIRVIKKAEYPGGYDDHYYFTDVTVDIDNHLMARISGNIWDAMKFQYNSMNNDETQRINGLIEFIKTCFTPKKNYKIELIPIKLEY